MKPLAAALLLCCTALSQTFPGAAELDSAINQAIRKDQIPGAVVLIGHGGKIVYRKAYGNRAILPAREPMTLDTIFDIASLTKIVATTSGLMKLFEEGRICRTIWSRSICRNFRAATVPSPSAI